MSLRRRLPPPHEIVAGGLSVGRHVEAGLARYAAVAHRRWLRPFDRWLQDTHPDRPLLAGTSLVLALAVGIVGVLAAATEPTLFDGSRIPLDRAAGVPEAAPVPHDVAASATAATAGAGARGAGAPSPPPPAPAEPAPEVSPAPENEVPGSVPVGKGMWIWQPEAVEGGDVDRLVARADEVGLTHVYVRTGSTPMGFHGAAFLDEVLPAAHAAGIKVYGWDFPYFLDGDVQTDIDRAIAAVNHEAPGGHRIDGFVPDVETPFEGTHLTPERGKAYADGLRGAVGTEYPLTIAVPRPSELMLARGYPYADLIAPMDAVAPMVYWLNRQPDSDVVGAIDYLSQFDKPIIPIGQAYDGLSEGGRPGPPPPEEIDRFLRTAEKRGAVGASFWSWQHANPAIWQAIAAAPQFVLPVAPAAQLSRPQIRAFQAALATAGFDVATTGAWDSATASALGSFQAAMGLPATGDLDRRTHELLLGPR